MAEMDQYPFKIAEVASTKIMARLMSDEASKRGILINAVCPGMVDTGCVAAVV